MIYRMIHFHWQDSRCTFAYFSYPKKRRNLCARNTIVLPLGGSSDGLFELIKINSIPGVERKVFNICIIDQWYLWMLTDRFLCMISKLVAMVKTKLWFNVWKDMHVIGKDSWNDSEVGKFFPSSSLYKSFPTLGTLFDNIVGYEITSLDRWEVSFYRSVLYRREESANHNFSDSLYSFYWNGRI